jgi:hypothetical protein
MSFEIRIEWQRSLPAGGVINLLPNQDLIVKGM